ncbi:MAG: choice-of-anchor Q domain-containing protein [Chloroflexota bacterium]|nr:right-handed parallel beta-helix repeat-containing protein [Chloroflexota bacterium]MBI5704061.1 right-handed parallel beta-helix repeat-containing protein [Chloroflexota bacterium]
MKIFNVFIRWIFLLTILSLSLIACTLLDSIRNLELFVSPTGSDENDCQTVERACRHIRTAVERAAPNSIIRIAPGRYQENIWVDRSLQLLGEEGVILEGGEGARRDPRLLEHDFVLFISARREERTIQVRIENLTIQNSRRIDGPHGSGIHKGNAELVLKNVTVQNNEGPGLLVVGEGNLIVDNSRFLNNGGAGIEITHRANILVKNSLVEGNRQNGIVNEGVLVMHDSTIRANSGQEGGIENRSDASIYGSTIYDNNVDDASRRSYSGGITNYGQILLVNTTISSNRGAGFSNIGPEANANLIHVTIAQNLTHGISISGENSFRMQNSLVVFNNNQDCYSLFLTASITTSPLAGVNIDSDNSCLDYDTNQRASWDFNPGVGSLGNYGGSTLTHPLLLGSPAIDAADCPSEITTDQRGVARPQGERCDVGAFEWNIELVDEIAITPPLIAPTATPFAIVAVEGTVTPSPTLPAVPTFIPTETSTPGLPLIVFTQNANCRKGPSTVFKVVTTFEQGKQVQALGRNAENTWLLVAIPSGGECWVAVSLIEPIDLVLLPLVPTPIPPPPPPSQLSLDSSQCSPNGYVLVLRWQDVNGESGYRLYRDGALLATLAANTTSYKDNPPLGGPYTYTLEAFSEAGSSLPVQLQVPKCKP